MIHFRIKPYENVVEILDSDDHLLGRIFAEEYGLRLTSKYLHNHSVEISGTDLQVTLP